MVKPNRILKLSELAQQFNLQYQGAGDSQIDGIGTLADATTSQISFLANPAYRSQLANSRAGAVILTANDAKNYSGNCLISQDPYVSYAQVASLFDTRRLPKPGIDPSASIHPSTTLGNNIYIGANVVIDSNCKLGDGCSIGPGCVLLAECELGTNCRLLANVTLCEGVKIGNRAIIHPGAIIGADGFGLAFDQDHWQKIPQIGSVRIGDDCEIGANTTIDRGAVGDTVLEADVRLDNQIQIGHNVRIGAHTAMASKVGISGSTQIGQYCIFAGNSGSVGHISIADHTTVNFRSVVTKSIRQPGTVWSAALPAQPAKEWRRILARFRKLDKLAQRVFNLERNAAKNETIQRAKDERRGK